MRYDLAIVGGGTAGLVAAVTAAGLGGRVVLIERCREPGGDCLWTGCVPSKTLLAAAELAHRMRNAHRVGLAPVEPEIDFARVMGHVHEVRRRIAPDDSRDRLRAVGADVLEGDASFVSPGRIAVAGRELRCRAALVATGSEPVVPRIDGLAEAETLTNETVWDLTELPRRLVVVGAGPVGCELSQAFARLGSSVTLVENGSTVLAKEEPEVHELMTARFAAEGIDVRTRDRAVRVEGDRDGRVLVLEGESGETRLPFDRVLLAVGRRPVTDGLELERIGVATDARGAVQVDATLRTTARGVFAAGDVTGGLPFTHVAGHQGRTVATNALFHLHRRFHDGAVPWVTYTDPEVARVGLTEAQARERFGSDITVAHHEYAQLDRARTAGQPYGFAKLVGDPRGRLVGATVAAPHGGEAIAELTARLEARGRLEDVSRSVHAYPTFAEGPARAADTHLRERYFTPGMRRLTRPLLGVLRAVSRGG